MIRLPQKQLADVLINYNQDDQTAKTCGQAPAKPRTSKQNKPPRKAQVEDTYHLKTWTPYSNKTCCEEAPTITNTRTCNREQQSSTWSHHRQLRHRDEQSRNKSPIAEGETYDTLTLQIDVLPRRQRTWLRSPLRFVGKSQRTRQWRMAHEEGLRARDLRRGRDGWTQEMGHNNKERATTKPEVWKIHRRQTNHPGRSCRHGVTEARQPHSHRTSVHEPIEEIYHLPWAKSEPPSDARRQARERKKARTPLHDEDYFAKSTYRTGGERCRRTHLPTTQKASKGRRRRKPRSTETFTLKADLGSPRTLTAVPKLQNRSPKPRI